MNNTPILYNEYNVLDKDLKNKNFYVYVLLDQRFPGEYNFKNYLFNYKPYYVGKGKNDRVRKHFWGLKPTLEETRKHNHDNNYCISETFSIWNELNEYPYFVIIEYFTDQKDALLKEKELILNIGQIINSTGPLTNINSVNNYSWDLASLEILPSYKDYLIKRSEKISKAKKGKRMDSYSIEKSRRGLIKYYQTHDVWNKGIPRDEETKAKISRTKRERFAADKNYGKASPEGLQKIKETSSKNQKGMLNSNENTSIWILEEKATKNIFILFGGIQPFLKSQGDTYSKFKAKTSPTSKFRLVKAFQKKDLSYEILQSPQTFINDFLIERGFSSRNILYYKQGEILKWSI